MYLGRYWTYAVYLDMLETFFIAKKKFLSIAVSIQRGVRTDDSISQ